MAETIIGAVTCVLVGFALGFKLHERIMQPMVDDYDRRLRQDARAFLRGERLEP